MAVDRIGGFLDSKSGQLRSRESLAADEKSASADSSGQTATDPAAGKSDAAVVKDSFRPVQERFGSQLSKVDERLQSEKEDASAAISLVREEIGVVNDLKSALDSGDVDAEAEARTALDDVAKRRKDLSASLDERSSQRQEEGTQFLRVGTQELFRVRPEKIELGAITNKDLKTVDDTKARLDELRAERATLVEQRSGLQATDKAARAAGSEGSAALDKLQTNSTSALRDYGEAEKLTDSLTRSISGLTKNELVQGVHGNLANVQNQVIQSLQQG